MIQGRGRASLLKKSAAPIFIYNSILREDLQRYDAVELFVVRLIDRTHAAGPEELQNPIVRYEFVLRDGLHREIRPIE